MPGIKVKIPTRIGPCYPRCAPTYGQAGRGSRSHRLISGLLPGEAPQPINGLLNNLIAYWPGNEVAGNALDAHTNGLDLTDVNTVTSNPGQVYALARQYTRANNEYHTRPGDDALLSTGDVDFTLAAWVYIDAKATMGIISKDSGAGPTREYNLLFSSGSDRFLFTVFDGTNVVAQPVANTFGSPSLATWYLLIGWHDATANQAYISVNNGAADSAATGGTAPGDTTQPFRIGLQGAVNLWNGRIGPSAMWKSAAGGGGALTAAQRTALWNGGAGLTYAQLTV